MHNHSRRLAAQKTPERVVTIVALREHHHRQLGAVAAVDALRNVHALRGGK